MKDSFGGMYANKSVFVTGHTGFKGTWLSHWLKNLGATVSGYARAPNTTPSHFALLQPDIHSTIGELLDHEALAKAMQTAAPEIVFHLAAQPLVRKSYDDPRETYNSNVIGTLNMCEAVRRCPSVKAVVAITTDKVYENNEWVWGYRETDRLGGFDPYSSSKACAELLLSSYRNSYWNPAEFSTSHDTLLAVVRAGNVIGGGDWSKDRLIPDIMKATAAGDECTIRNPSATRPWQHVLECLSGYLLVGQKLLERESALADSFNFGPFDHADNLTVGEVAKLVQKAWPSAEFTYPELTGQPHEANVLFLDCSKARTLLHWEPIWNSRQAVERTVTWYKALHDSNDLKTRDDLELYVKQARERGAVWA